MRSRNWFVSARTATGLSHDKRIDAVKQINRHNEYLWGSAFNPAILTEVSAPITPGVPITASLPRLLHHARWLNALTFSAIAFVWSGVLPQHEPTMFAPKVRTSGTPAAVSGGICL